MKKMNQGIIKKYFTEKKFGFIDGKDDIFFHVSNVKNPNEIQEGKTAEYRIREGGKGPEAYDVKIIEVLNELVEFLDEHVLNLSGISNKEYDQFIDISKNYTKRIQSDVTTTSIRKIYARIINAKNSRDIKTLRPIFAYEAGRKKEEGKMLYVEFMDLLDSLAKKINSDEEVKNFKSFMETIVAYRKYIGK